MTPRPELISPTAQFRDPQLAAQNLGLIAERVPEAVLHTVAALLSDSPDPDSALNLFERLTEAADLGSTFTRIPSLIHYALAVFGHSRWLGERLIHNPELFHRMGREKGFAHAYSCEHFEEAFARFRACALDCDAPLLLARFKHREYIRILLRDVLGVATLAETTAELSALADVLIGEALRACDATLRNRYGSPQHLDPEGRLVDTSFAVFALGKLGGNELNYSSDVDLFFLYGDGEDAPGATISNREYFVRLARDVTATLSTVTPEGAVFRIDLRLRPQGGEGEPAAGLNHALEYYANRAEDWERQALIKIRYCAGDQRLAREFIRSVQPYVYTERLNFAAIDTALLSREKMRARRKSGLSSRENERAVMDVKLDRGGIRDIEFLVQCLQRVYGGSEPWLRSGGTLFSLQKLHDKGHISGKEFHELTTAYEFLRAVEHRLQFRDGRQTHKVPEGDELRVLARSLSPRFIPQADPDLLLSSLRERMAAVAAIHSRIVYQEQLTERTEVGGEFHLISTIPAGREESHRQILERLAVDAPAVYRFAQRDLAPHARKNLFRFLSAASTSSERYAAVVKSSEAIDRALALLATSEYLTDVLVRHPEEIASLVDIWARPEHSDAGLLFEFPLEHEDSGLPILIANSSVDSGEKLAILRRHYRSRVFTACARTVLQHRSVYHTLADITAASDEAIRAAVTLANPPEGFAVLALGRLGTREHDLLSDADLIFVRDENLDPNFALRAASEVIEALSAYTREGTVFPVDSRLRPRGAEGELVVTPSGLRLYFSTEAQQWEALTWTKLRHVAGSAVVAEQTIHSTSDLLERFAGQAAFTGAAREMRARLEKTAESGDVKGGAGGLYDIDFIIGSLLVRHGVEQTRGNLRQRLISLGTRGLLSENCVRTLDEAAELFRTVEHTVRLVVGRTRRSLPGGGQPRDAVESLVRAILRRDYHKGLEAAIQAAMLDVRKIFNQVVS